MRPLSPDFCGAVPCEVASLHNYRTAAAALAIITDSRRNMTKTKGESRVLVLSQTDNKHVFIPSLLLSLQISNIKQVVGSLSFACFVSGP